MDPNYFSNLAGMDLNINQIEALIGFMFLKHQLGCQLTPEEATLIISRCVAAQSEAEWREQFEQINQEATKALEGSRYAKYEYKAQMARKVPRTANKTDEQRQRNNESSRRSRFRRARRNFMQRCVISKGWALSDQLGVRVNCLIWLTAFLEACLQSRGVDLTASHEFFSQLTNYHLMFQELLKQPAETSGKRKWSQMQNE